MKVAWLLALAILAGSARAGPRDSAESIILALEIAWNRAVQQRDGRAVEPLLGNELIYIDYDGTVMNKGQYMASVKSSALHAEQVTNESMKVRVHGERGSGGRLPRKRDQTRQAVPAPRALCGYLAQSQRRVGVRGESVDVDYALKTRLGAALKGQFVPRCFRATGNHRKLVKKW